MKNIKFTCLLLFVIFLLLIRTSEAYYIPPTLVNMVGTSDLIVIGEIVGVGDKTFQLKIERLVSGEYKGQLVEVNKFQNWTCSSRWDDYKIGQRVMAFMNLSKESGLENQKKQIYTLRSGGSEGEFPIFDNKVYVQTIFHNNSFNSVPFPNGVNGHGYPFEINELITAIQGYNECFKIKTDDKGLFTDIHQNCSEEQLNQYKQGSKLQEYLINENLERGLDWGI